VAVDETGYGVEPTRSENLFASQRVFEFIRPMRTGASSTDREQEVIEIAEPFGVVAAVVPSTNPTSRIYKILISLKAGSDRVDPHRRRRAASRGGRIMGGRRYGCAPAAASGGWGPSRSGTQETMRHRDVAVILATAAWGGAPPYAPAKPGLRVGPGNALLHQRSADLAGAARDIVLGKTFDNGVLCSSPNSVVVDAPVAEEARRRFQAEGAHFLNAQEMDKLAGALVTAQRLPNLALVGKSARLIAEKIGITVPDGTRALIAPLAGVGRDYPLSIEKLCPVSSMS
jgi:acetaldehyde dehydrogenase (acetylating)